MMRIDIRITRCQKMSSIVILDGEKKDEIEGRPRRLLHDASTATGRHSFVAALADQIAILERKIQILRIL